MKNLECENLINKLNELAIQTDCLIDLGDKEIDMCVKLSDVINLINSCNNKEIVDCHYCKYASCEDEKGSVSCYADNYCYFDHYINDSKEEAKNCNMFTFCDVFPKF